MNIKLKPLVLAVTLATSALTVLAQSGPGPAAGQGAGHGMHAHAGAEHGERQAHMARRAAALKAKLQLNAEQENSWNAFVAAMQPPAHAMRPQREEMAKLSTPERLDKMSELRKQREAIFAQREAATRNFYSVLNAEQKKVFDESTMRLHRHGHGQHRGHG